MKRAVWSFYTPALSNDRSAITTCMIRLCDSTFLNFVVQVPVVQSVVSLTSSLMVILFTVLADSIYSILIIFAEKNVSSFCTAKAIHIFSAKKKKKKKKNQHICVSLDVKFNESLTNDVVSSISKITFSISSKAPQGKFIDNFFHDKEVAAVKNVCVHCQSR